MHNVLKLCKKEQKMGFSRGFCHFLDFGDSDWLDIAYDGSPKRCGSSEVETCDRCHSAVGSSTDVEHVPLGTLQFSTSVEGRVLIGGWLVGWLVSYSFSWRTAPRIFLIFCMNVPYHKGKKRTRRFFQEKSGSFNNHENVPKMALFWLWSDIAGKPG